MHFESGGAARPVVGLRGAVGHDAGGAAHVAVVVGSDSLFPVFHERERGADRQRPAVVGVAYLAPGRSVSFEEHELRAAVIPKVQACVAVLTAVLHSHRSTDPLPAGELRGGRLNLRELVAAVRLSRADVTATATAVSPRGNLRRNGKTAVAHVGPVRA